MSKQIVVISAGLSSPSSTRVLADELAASTERALADDATADVQVTVIELRGLAHALVDNLLTGFPAPELKSAIDSATGADGLIAVTPIFTASYNALFKAFFDVLDDEALVGMPVLIAATGGTERHSLALEHELRPLFGYLRAQVVPTAVYAASNDFGAPGGGSALLRERITRAGRELAGLVVALPRPARRDEFDDAVPFAQLLAR